MKNGMKQCMLVNDAGAVTVAWIPGKFAVVGKYLDLYEDGGGWIPGWRVMRVYDVQLEYEYVREHERDHMSQREASDI